MKRGCNESNLSFRVWNQFATLLFKNHAIKGGRVWQKKIHFHKKYSSVTFKCFTCYFTCETYSELVEHNDIYYYSHRQKLNKEYEKEILDEFQRLDEDGFLIHRKLDWWDLLSVFVRIMLWSYPLIRHRFVFWINPCNFVTKIE